jgi:hypothetical protein
MSNHITEAAALYTLLPLITKTNPALADIYEARCRHLINRHTAELHRDGVKLNADPGKCVIQSPTSGDYHGIQRSLTAVPLPPHLRVKIPPPAPTLPPVDAECKPQS